jgi:hypothetical protein
MSFTILNHPTLDWHRSGTKIMTKRMLEDHNLFDHTNTYQNQIARMHMSENFDLFDHNDTCKSKPVPSQKESLWIAL